MCFTDDERRRYADAGFLLRPDVFTAAEVAALREAVEAVVAGVVSRAQRPGAGPAYRLADGHRAQLSSRSVIQWEWAEASRHIRLVEPFTHLDARFAALWDDPRFVEPMRDALGVPAVGPYTCKLNLKRPREGSHFPWHQDYPYWYAFTPSGAHEIATAMLLLDDATVANGALRVLPGSHRLGPVPRDPRDPTGFLADAARLDTAGECVVEAPAGAVLFFPAFTVHCSGPNGSDAERRALLLSFQPAGRPPQRDLAWHPERVATLP